MKALAIFMIAWPLAVLFVGLGVAAGPAAAFALFTILVMALSLSFGIGLLLFGPPWR